MFQEHEQIHVKSLDVEVVKTTSYIYAYIL